MTHGENIREQYGVTNEQVYDAWDTIHAGLKATLSELPTNVLAWIAHGTETTSILQDAAEEVGREREEAENA